MMPSLPSTLLGWLALLAIAAPLVQLTLGRWLPAMAMHHRQIVNQVSFLCMGLGLGAVASTSAWVAAWPATAVLVVILAVSLCSALSLLGRTPSQIGGWSAPFTLCLAACAGFFAAEHASLPAILVGLALAIDLSWAVLGRFMWELENRPFHGPAINLNAAGDGVAASPGIVPQSGVPSASPSGAMASTAVAKAMLPAVPRDTFESLIGMEETKHALAAALRRALADPETRNGILLFGPPGNGKTRLVRAACGTLGVPMVEMAIADLVSPHHGQGPRALSDAFDQACRAPGYTVLFLDEIDAVLTDRGSQASLAGDAALLTQVFLTKVSEARTRGLIVIGATNFMERLDPAAIREGRFDHRLEVPHPDAATRRVLLGRLLPGLSAVENEVAVQRLGGYSIARIVALAERVRERAPGAALSWDTLQQALRELQGTSGQSLDGVPQLSELCFNAALRDHLAALRDRIRHAGAVLAAGGQPPSGALFSGPSGTGKTLAARALARELGLAFFPATGYDLVRQDGTLDRLFRQAAETRPSLVFLDEAEDILAVREAAQPGLAGGLSGKLLAWLDGASGRPVDVIVVAATNHPERVDPAFLRPGRLTEHVAFTLPDVATLTALCAQALATRHLEGIAGLTPARFAALMQGAAPAALAPVLDQALSDSLVRGTPVTLDDVARAASRMGFTGHPRSVQAPPLDIATTRT